MIPFVAWHEFPKTSNFRLVIFKENETELHIRWKPYLLTNKRIQSVEKNKTSIKNTLSIYTEISVLLHIIYRFAGIHWDNKIGTKNNILIYIWVNNNMILRFLFRELSYPVGNTLCRKRNWWIIFMNRSQSQRKKYNPKCYEEIIRGYA